MAGYREGGIILVPTRMGMIPKRQPKGQEEVSCPHTHGDDPKGFVSAVERVNLSPHAWG